MNLLIIDVGTSSMRGILYRDTMDKLLSSQRKYCPNYNEAGQLYQKAEEFEHALIKIIQTISKQADRISETIDILAITAQRSSVIALDEIGHPLMDVIMWQDTRNQEVCRELEKHNKKISMVSGACVNTVFSGGKMAWLRQERPDIFRKVHKLVNIPEYLIHIMTDNYVTDFTYGSRTHLMNLKEKRWDFELLSLFGMKEEYLCELLPPGSICGTVTDEFAAKTGLRDNIPVLTAGGDQQCAQVGQGVFLEGKLSMVTGTGAFLTILSDRMPQNLPSGLICNSAAIRGKYMIEANVLTCCSAFDWYVKNFYGEGDYSKVNQELEGVYGKRISCTALPYFQGRSMPQWNARASATLHNITFLQTRAELLKALLEGIFLEIKNNIDLLLSYGEVNCVHISGGLTKSAVMNQMQADVYGMPLFHMEDAESTALGALMVALYSLGVYPSYEEMYERICQISPLEVIHPIETTDYYQNKQREMNLLYEKLYGGAYE